MKYLDINVTSKKNCFKIKKNAKKQRNNMPRLQQNSNWQNILERCGIILCVALIKQEISKLQRIENAVFRPANILRTSSYAQTPTIWRKIDSSTMETRIILASIVLVL